MELVATGLAAVDPERTVARQLEIDPPPGTVTVLALGKAAPAMIRGAARVLGSSITDALVISDHHEPVPAGAELLVSSHPVPDASSLRAGQSLLARATTTRNPILALLSGGGSALAEVPAAGLSLEVVAETYNVLLRAGVPVEDANTVRIHLSRLKGGRLALASSQPIRTLALSDVRGDPAAVASGPTVACRSTPADAISVLEAHGLLGRVPAPVLSHLAAAEAPPPPPHEDLRVVADGATAGRAMASARRLPTRLISTELAGAAAVQAVAALSATPPGSIGILTGEATVTVRGRGRGGRNQEAALAAAIELEGTDDSFLAFASDGVDGPTDAAGAYVDGTTAARIAAAGIEPREALANNDSYTALDAAGALIRCGPTGVNVADLWLVDRR